MRILQDNETWEDAAKRLHRENRNLQEAMGPSEAGEGPPPYEEREEMRMVLAKLWTVRLEPPMAGPRDIAVRALNDNGIRPVDWNSSGLILIPPMKQTNLVTAPFEIIKKSIEKGDKYRVDYQWPYGFGE